MDKQLIISVGREFGSGGHVIAEDLAKRFDLPLYDNNLLEYVAGEKQVDQQRLVKYDEKPKNKFLHRTVRGYSSSPQENVAHMQFDYLKNLASKGESFV
ncbi:MAG: cytidylate kinase family protein, partial [Clostridia bacterium]|nr:cytidylate kinase family protein [Clostridia bacterium]MDY5555244.1 cytidylate kinase family protein [Blautia sp.]